MARLIHSLESVTKSETEKRSLSDETAAIVMMADPLHPGQNAPKWICAAREGKTPGGFLIGAPFFIFAPDGSHGPGPPNYGPHGTERSFEGNPISIGSGGIAYMGDNEGRIWAILLPLGN